MADTYVSPIAVPLVSGKLESKALKALKKAHGAKSIKRGVPEVTKFLRKDKKGLVVFAADVFPVDLIAHMPTLCEEKDVLYAYVKNRSMLGEALSSKRGVSVCFIPQPTSDSPYESAFQSFESALKIVHPYMGEGKEQDNDDEEGSKKRSSKDEDGEEPAKKKKKKDKKE